MVKYILISGGVFSSVGKGIITASLGYMLKNYGYKVTCIKIDPYLNVDAGTMSPSEHGEVFVLEDGGEVDLDLGNYERYLDIKLTKENNITSGKIFKSIIKKEREGKYLGKTIQYIPHVTNEIKNWILNVSKKPTDNSQKEPEICLIELGGTPGDMESMAYFESFRQIRVTVGRENLLHLHVTFIPELTISKEQKSKPAQQNFIDLRNAGINADIVLCRSKRKICENIKEKIALYGMVKKENVISVPDVKDVFEIPNLLKSQNLPYKIYKMLKIDHIKLEKPLKLANEILEFNNIKDSLKEIKIGFIGKYVSSNNSDCYISLLNALKTSARKVQIKLNVIEIEAESFINELNSGSVEQIDGFLIPGGFGFRGIDGKILAANYARKKDVPFFGICLGMQIAVMEFAKNVLNLPNYGSSEFSTHKKIKVPKNSKPTIIYMPEINKKIMGGNMRLGISPTNLKKGSKIHSIYGKEVISERHRHRYEVNPDLINKFEEKNFEFTGKDQSGKRMEVFEYNLNKFHVGVQFHPEFTSNPRRDSKVISAFLKASFDYNMKRKLIKN